MDYIYSTRYLQEHYTLPTPGAKNGARVCVSFMFTFVDKRILRFTCVDTGNKRTKMKTKKNPDDGTIPRWNRVCDESSLDSWPMSIPSLELRCY